MGAMAGTILGAAANGLHPLCLLREYSRFFGQIVLIGLFFGFIISYIFISVEKISEEKVRRLESEKNAMEAELKLLQSQLEPHFLFNTLSNVLGLIDSDRGRARSMLESFTCLSSVVLADRTQQVRHACAGDGRRTILSPPL